MPHLLLRSRIAAVLRVPLPCDLVQAARMRGSRGWELAGVAMVVAVVGAPSTAHAEDKDPAVAAIIGGVGAGIAGLLGGGFMIAADAFATSADDTLAELAAKGYGAPCAVDRATCVSIDEDLESYDDAVVGATASFITGGVLLAGMTAGLIMMATEGRGGKASVEVLPFASAEGGGVCANVSF